jgi:hypothetical protein
MRADTAVDPLAKVAVETKHLEAEILGVSVVLEPLIETSATADGFAMGCPIVVGVVNAEEWQGRLTTADTDRAAVSVDDGPFQLLGADLKFGKDFHSILTESLFTASLQLILMSVVVPNRSLPLALAGALVIGVAVRQFLRYSRLLIERPALSAIHRQPAWLSPVGVEGCGWQGLLALRASLADHRPALITLNGFDADLRNLDPVATGLLVGGSTRAAVGSVPTEGCRRQ